VMDLNIIEKLKESADRVSRASLSPDEKNEGVQRLAWGMVVTGTFSATSPKCENGGIKDLEAGNCLSDWSGKRITELFDSSIFDDPSFERVSFCHRSVLERLASRWILEIMENNRSKIDALFFVEVDNRIVIPNHLIAVAAWVAQDDIAFRRNVIKYSPDVLVGYGDPGQLDMDTREKVLIAYMENQKETVDFDDHMLRRLAHKSLKDCVVKIIEDPDSTTQAKKIAYKLIGEGGISDCAELVMGLVMKFKDNHLLFPELLRCLQKISPNLDGLKEEIVSGLYPSRSAAAMIETLYPKYIGVNEVADIIFNISESTISGERWYIVHAINDHFNSRSSFKDLIKMLDRLNLCYKYDIDTLNEKIVDIIESTYWDIFTSALLKFDKNNEDEVSLMGGVILEADDVNRLRVHGYIGNKKSVSLINKSEELKKYLFLETIKRSTLEKKERLDSWYQLGIFSDIWDIQEHDCLWLEIEFNVEEDKVKKILIFDTILNSIPEETSALKEEVIDRIIKKNESCKTKLERIRSRADTVPNWKMEDERRQKVYQLRQKNIFEKNYIVFTECVDTISDGSRQDLINALCQETHKNSFSKYSDIDLTIIKEKYDVKIYNALMLGLIKISNTIFAKLPSEKENQDSTLIIDTLGLIGMQIRVEDGLVFKTMSDSDVEMAFRFALTELNGFPDWFEMLCNKQTNLIEELLYQELFRTINQSRRNPILEKLAYSAGVVRETAFRPVQKLLKEKCPTSIIALGPMLKIYFSGYSKNENNWIPNFKLKSKNVKKSEHSRRWWLAWFSLFPNDAIDFIYSKIKGPGSQKLFDVIFSDMYKWSQDNEGSLSNDIACIQLEKICELFLLFCSPEDDEIHDGVYTPGIRDNTEQLRGIFLGKLRKQNPDESMDIVMNLKNKFKSEIINRFLSYSYESLIYEYNNCKPMSPPRFYEWLKGVVCNIESSHDLYYLILQRLEEIANHVRDDEKSMKRTYCRRGIIEEDFQLLFAHELFRRSGGLYSVVREDEVADRKEPDIRLFEPGVSPTTIEAKLMDNWTLPELVKGLRKQLVGQYLDENNSKHGIYLLCHNGSKNRWRRTSSKKYFNFEQT
ncbi:MAG: hypothetical protein HRT57_08490, partial [Crocinitomicaceae bacterium]|nr:hypothetical protein [Crocinitomicaceae bacterium]